MWYLYILKSSRKKWYYVGSTNRLQDRISEHTAGKVLSTKSHRPLALVYSKEFPTEKLARDYEQLLKDKRIEKEKLIKKIEEDCGIV